MLQRSRRSPPPLHCTSKITHNIIECCLMKGRPKILMYTSLLRGIASSATLSILSIALLYKSYEFVSGDGNHSDSLITGLSYIRPPSYSKSPKNANSSVSGTNDQHNDFIIDFSRALGPIDPSSKKWPTVRNFIVLPMVLRNGKLFCRRILKEKMNDPNLSGGDTVYRRMRKAVEMIYTGLDLYSEYEFSSALPILFLNGDQTGCFDVDGIDTFNYPRLTWSLPSPKYEEYYGNKWCGNVGAPSYESWLTFHNKHKTHSSWESTFASYANEYPWTSKINKAVWRGSTTVGLRFKELPLKDIPRGKLVQKSMENPGLIDGAFVKFNQKFKGRELELANQTILADRMSFDDQMEYKAIIDIDGNSWSSRFPKLLCTNSVIIKIDPDYIEYFYHELKPMQHYVPASLENITEVAAYVLDKNNENEMKRIVDSANSWCKNKMTEKQIAKDMMKQLRKYEGALNNYMDEHNYNRSMIMETLFGNSPRILHVAVDDLVECY